MMERMKKLMSETLEDLWTQTFEEVRGMDAKISGEGMELLEKKQNLDDMLKERRNA